MRNKTRKMTKTGTRKTTKTGTRKTRTRNHWGYHLMIDAFKCDPKSIRSKSNIADFSKSLVKRIDMVAYGPPKIVRFGTGNLEGYTLVQLIETSNITAHFVEDTNSIYLDIFSCKKFNENDAIKCFQHYFKPLRIKKRFIKR